MSCARCSRPFGGSHPRGGRALGSGYADEFGSIEAGKSADMVILDRNLLEISTSEIHQTEVEQTIFLGKIVYQRN